MKKTFLAWYQPRQKKALLWLKPLVEKLRVWWLPRQKKLMAWWLPQQEKLHALAKPRLKQLQARWQGLNQRERYSIFGGGLATTILLFYTLIWSPLNTHLSELRTRISSEKKTAAWIQAADKELRSLETKRSKLPVKQLSQRINAVQEDLRQAPISQNLTQLTQSAPDEIHAVFDKVDFDQLIAWIMDFSQQHNLTVKQATVKRLNSVGLVQAEFVFRVAG